MTAIDSPLGHSLRDRLLRLLSIRSVSRQERALADDMEARARRIPGGELRRIGDELVLRFPALRGKPRLILCGHLDTVPPQDDEGPFVDGDRVVGLGASDLKAGLAVLEELAETLDVARCVVDPVFVYYTCEEVGYEESGLVRLREEARDATEGALAICVEPTDNAVELGCLGTLQAKVVVHGRTAHSARPWQGKNAVHAAAPLLTRIAALPIRDHHASQSPPIVFREVLNVTMIRGGIANNVIPGSVELNLNLRFAPDRDEASARAFVEEVVGGEGTVEFLDCAPPGKVVLDNEWASRLCRLAGNRVQPKQAWTDVGRFSDFGVDAVSFGPGLTSQAHQRGEYATVSGMLEHHRILAALLRGE